MGSVGGDRHYDGPGIAGWVAWKCPACAEGNTGAIEAGCVNGGSGSARPYSVGIGQPPPTEDLHLPRPQPPEVFDDVVPAVGFAQGGQINGATLVRLALQD